MSSITSCFSTSSVILEGVKLFLRKIDHPLRYCLSLINLNDLENKLADPLMANRLLAFLSPREKEILSQYTFAKRKREWFGGRLSAKHAALSLVQEDSSKALFADLSVLPQENGSPKLYSSSIVKHKLPALSISHSGSYAVAMASEENSCGIDIQIVSDKTTRVSDRFCNKQERKLLNNSVPQLNEEERLTLLWSAKEALKKSMLADQPVIFQGVILQSLDVGPFFTLQLQFPGGKDKNAEVTAVKLEDYILAFTTVGSINA